MVLALRKAGFLAAFNLVSGYAQPDWARLAGIAAEQGAISSINMQLNVPDQTNEGAARLLHFTAQAAVCASPRRAGPPLRAGAQGWQIVLISVLRDGLRGLNTAKMRAKMPSAAC